MEQACRSDRLFYFFIPKLYCSFFHPVLVPRTPSLFPSFHEVTLAGFTGTLELSTPTSSIYSFQSNNTMATWKDKAVFLARSDDWELWNLQFQAQAVAGGCGAKFRG